MAEVIVFSENPSFKYRDRESKLSREEVEKRELESTTVYVGKLCQDPPTSESQLYSIFSQCGPIKRIIMGVRKESLEPAGFCFIEFCTRESALASIKWMNDSMIDRRKIVVNIDYGFEEGRQYLREKRPINNNRGRRPRSDNWRRRPLQNNYRYDD